MSGGDLWTPAYVGLGSNLDDPVRQVNAAFDELAALRCCRLVARSRLYLTDPVGVRDQPRFVNAAAGLLTRLEPVPLLRALKDLEARHGRRPDTPRWGPRTLDLDLLAYDAAQVEEPGLSLPHREIASRGFVLVPLEEIAPDLLLPGLGSVAQLAARCERRGVDLIEGA